jgi:hypothetical protein
MRRSLRKAALAVALFGAISGCTRSVVQQNKQPPDPLLVSKKPVEGKPTSGPSPRELARVDPQPPQWPVDDTMQTAGSEGAPVRLSSDLVVRPDR